MLYLLDTNIILAYLRQDKVYEYVEQHFDPFATENTTVISVVSLGEVKALALRNQWGSQRLQNLKVALAQFIPIDINAEDIIEKYATIEVYSQNKLANQPLPQGTSAKNMGKNDLWIASTASVIEATLLSTDKDFEHLDKVFLDFQLIPL